MWLSHRLTFEGASILRKARVHFWKWGASILGGASKHILSPPANFLGFVLGFWWRCHSSFNVSVVHDDIWGGVHLKKGASTVGGAHPYTFYRLLLIFFICPVFLVEVWPQLLCVGRECWGGPSILRGRPYTFYRLLLIFLDLSCVFGGGAAPALMCWSWMLRGASILGSRPHILSPPANFLGFVLCFWWRCCPCFYVAVIQTEIGGKNIKQQIFS